MVDEVRSEKDNSSTGDQLFADAPKSFWLSLMGDTASWPNNMHYRLSRNRNPLVNEWSAIILGSKPENEAIIFSTADLTHDQPEYDEPCALFESTKVVTAKLRLEVRLDLDAVIEMQPSSVKFKLSSSSNDDKILDRVSLIVRTEISGTRVDPSTALRFSGALLSDNGKSNHFLQFTANEQRFLADIASTIRTENHKSLHLAFTFNEHIGPFRFGDVKLVHLRKTADEIKLSTIVSYAESLNDEELIELNKAVQEKFLYDRIRKSFSNRNWSRIRLLSEAVLPDPAKSERLSMMVGRACIYDRANAEAIAILSRASLLAPRNADLLFYNGVAKLRAEMFEEAELDLREALQLAPDDIRVRKELGNALRRRARSILDLDTRRELEREAIEHLSASLSSDFSIAGAINLCRILLDNRFYKESYELTQRSIKTDANNVTLLTLMSRSLVGMGRNGEALKVASQILELDPDNLSARYNIKVLRFLDDDQTPTRHSLGDFTVSEAASDTHDEQALERGSVREKLADSKFDWLTLPNSPRIAELQPNEMALLETRLSHFFGFEQFESSRGSQYRLWRRDALLNLFESGLLDGPSPWEAAKTFEERYINKTGSIPAGSRIALLSRHGSYKFGGGEHFLAAMAEHYQIAGYDPVIIGTRPEFKGKTGLADGIRFAFIDSAPAALRHFFISENVRLVHVLSGLGFQTAEALNFTNIPFVYGVHFWREALGASDEAAFFKSDGTPIPRPEFAFLLSRAATVYSNSEFTRDILEEAYSVRTPVIYSVPPEIELGAST